MRVKGYILALIDSRLVLADLRTDPRLFLIELRIDPRTDPRTDRDWLRLYSHGRQFRQVFIYDFGIKTANTLITSS